MSDFLTLCILQDNVKTIVIEDSTAAPGRSYLLANALLNQLERGAGHIASHVFANEISPLDLHLSSTEARVHQLSHTDGPLEVIKEVSSIDTPTNVMINSLSSFLLEHSVQIVAKLFHNLVYTSGQDKVKKIIATIHGDCHLISEVESLVNHVDLWIRIQSADFTRTSVIQNHKSGKMSKSFIDVTVDLPTAKLIGAVKSSKDDLSQQQQQAASKSEDDDVMPTTSFSLNLTDKEKVARNNLELPFWKESKIDYVPDDNDDWDEEDPDEDLDF